MRKVYKIILIGLVGAAVLAGASLYVLAVNDAGNSATGIKLPEASIKSADLSAGTLPESANSDITAITSADSTATSTDQAVGGKLIEVDLSEQRLTYFNADGTVEGSFLISSGIKRLPTPTGTFYVLVKIPVKLYKGPGYYLPNTKWNLNFLPGYYIHGAYWHHNFGHVMSHGCVNVSYANMEGLYNWAEVGTKIIIHD